MIFCRLLDITEHPQVHSPTLYIPKTVFIILFDRFLTAHRSKESEWSKTGRKVNKNCKWSAKGKTICLKCSVLPNYRLENVGGEFVTSIDHYDDFYANLLFDAPFIDRCAHIRVIATPRLIENYDPAFEGEL